MTIADELDWPFLFCSDEDRQLYRRLALGSAPIRQLFTKGTLAIYAAARIEGRPLPLPVEDPRQLGGDAVVVAGVARHDLPADEPRRSARCRRAPTRRSRGRGHGVAPPVVARRRLA